MSENDKIKKNKSAEKSTESTFRQLPFTEEPVSVFYNAATDLLGTHKLGDNSKKAKDMHSR